jgi:RNA polymerase sigma-70 factor (ECF subfamily)
MSTPTPEAQFLAAYDTHADAIFRFCYAHLGNRDRAKDAVQETFVRIWAYLAKGKRIDAMKPFIYRTARNFLIDQARRPQFASLDALRDGGFDVADERTLDPAISADASRAIRLASSLDTQYRDAVLLRYVTGMMPKDIAAVTGETENVVSVRINRGLGKLRTLLNQ